MIERSSEAIIDLAAHVLYLNKKVGPETALRFVDAVQEALEKLEKFLNIGRIRHFRQKGLRSWMVPGFENWLLFICRWKKVSGFIASLDLEAQLGVE